MITLYLPVLICILGALLHIFAANPAVKELGRLAFGIGLFVSLR